MSAIQQGRAAASSPYLDTQGAVNYLNGIIGRRQLERYRMQGGGPRYAKLGRRAVYTREWLDAWIGSRSFTNSAEARRAGVI